MADRDTKGMTHTNDTDDEEQAIEYHVLESVVRASGASGKTASPVYLPRSIHLTEEGAEGAASEYGEFAHERDLSFGDEYPRALIVPITREVIDGGRVHSPD